jgi:acyl carrier protein
MGAVSARELATLIVETLNLEGVTAAEIDLAAPIFGDGLGLDSLDMLEISLVIQQRYGVKLKADDPQNEVIFASLQALAQHLSVTPAASG